MSKTNTGVLACVYVAMVAVLIVAILLIAGRHSAHAATGTTDPVTGQINQVAIDMDPTGNAPGTGGTNHLGQVDSVRSNVPLNSTVMVDVIIDEVAPADGNLIGFGFNLIYDPAIVSINGHNSAFMVAPGGFEPGAVPDPDSSGDWRYDFITNSAGSHIGEGVLVEIGIQCDATGSSTLKLTDDPPIGDLVPDIFAHTNTASGGDFTVPMPVNNWTGKSGGLPAATIYCGEGTPGPTNSPSPTLSPTPVGQTPSPTPSPTSTGPTPSPSPTLSPTPVGQTPSPTPSPSPTHAATPTPTNTPVQTTPTPTGTPPTSATASATPRPTCNTTLATSANLGASTISVVSALGCDPGDTIRISGGTANQEDIKIAGGTQAATTSMTLATALTKSHAAGDTVIEIASAATPTPTPAALPKTGGIGSSGNTAALLLMLLLGGTLIVAAGGSVFVARANRKE